MGQGQVSDSPHLRYDLLHWLSVLVLPHQAPHLCSVVFHANDDVKFAFAATLYCDLCLVIL